MRKFKVGRKIIKLWKWVRHGTQSRPPHYRRLGGQYSQHESKTLARICSWGRRLGDKLRQPRLPPKLSGYARLADEPAEAEAARAVPKGHLAVYVGQKDDDHHRYLVPVIYFNHPLFGQLLREAEEEFGFHHPGGITIPCRESEFESVRMKIAACDHKCRKLLAWKPRF